MNCKFSLLACALGSAIAAELRPAQLLAAGPRYTSALLERLRDAIETRLMPFITTDNCLAALLDPTLKTTGMGKEKDKETKEELRRLLMARLAVHLAENDKAGDVAVESDDTSALRPSPAKRPKLLAFIDDDDNDRERHSSGPSQTTPQSLAKEAMEWYFEKPKAKDAPLAFWRAACSSCFRQPC